jgi:hypothetical protein
MLNTMIMLVPAWIDKHIFSCEGWGRNENDIPCCIKNGLILRHMGA